VTSLITHVCCHIGSLYNVGRAVVVCLRNSVMFVRDKIMHSLYVIHCATIVLCFLFNQKLKIPCSFLVYNQMPFLLVCLSQCMWWTSTEGVFGFSFVLFFSWWNISSEELLWQSFFLPGGFRGFHFSFFLLIQVCVFFIMPKALMIMFSMNTLHYQILPFKFSQFLFAPCII
jgi:hypothetical protein